MAKLQVDLAQPKCGFGKIEKVFEKQTKMKVYHGTLNVKLDNDYVIKPDWIIKPEEYGGTQNVFVKKCKIKEGTAYIVRAEMNQIGKGHHDLKIIELVSDINFRETYNLKDEENIVIEIN